MSKLAVPASAYTCEVLIVHTSEAKEWAKYLQNVLRSSRKFPKNSIHFYSVHDSSVLEEYNSTIFHTSRCIVLLLSMAFLDMQSSPGVLQAFQDVFHPPNKMVILFCGVPEDEILNEYFENWQRWRKLYTEDEPAIYISTVLEAISDAGDNQADAETWEQNSYEIKASWQLDSQCLMPMEESQSMELLQENSKIVQEDQEQEGQEQEGKEQEGQQQESQELEDQEQEDQEQEDQEHKDQEQEGQEPERKEQVGQGQEGWETESQEQEGYEQEGKELKDQEQEDQEQEDPSSALMSSMTDVCLTIQPDRILCGTETFLYIILKCKLDTCVEAKVKFSCEGCSAKQVSGTFENEYTVSVNAPEMPPGIVSVTLYSNDSVVCSMVVTYFTAMGEISSYLGNVSSPLEFMCQAFNITSNCAESLDSLLAESFNSRIPACGLLVFGVNQLDKENMSGRRDEELPTLLHFAAKYGLKKLAGVLLQCPGALQAYSVANNNGEYPNNVAERNGFSDLRKFIDNYVETADMMNSPIEETIPEEENEGVYQCMSKNSQDLIMKYSLSPDNVDIYESMIELNPDCMSDLYEDMEKAIQASLNPAEAMLRNFFQGTSINLEKEDTDDEEEEEEAANPENWEEDPYNLCFPDKIYDTIDKLTSNVPEIINRPPAPIPRPLTISETEENKTYISKVFSEKKAEGSKMKHAQRPLTGPARTVRDSLSTSTYDPYAGMKTPGQRQLISLQERVKVGAITVEEAVLEFKEWQLNQDKRAQSIRFQQDNLKRLRDSITRRHKEKVKNGKEKDLEITAPLQQGLYQGLPMSVQCPVYEHSPHVMNQQVVPSQLIQRGGWQNGSSSSTSSSGSNRFSTHSTVSYSSGAEGDFEDSTENLPPPRPSRFTEVPRLLPPPRIPPRLPERNPESSALDRYIPSPSRALPQSPYASHLPSSPPPIPRRNW